jgi:hypothetical protein
MSHNNKVGAIIQLRVFFAVLFSVSSLASCGGGGGSTIVASTTPTPTVTVTADSTSIAYNGNTNIHWTSTNTTTCLASGGPGAASGGIGTTGSFSTGLLTATTTYTVTCGTAHQSVTITVASSAVSSVITGFANSGSGNVTVISANTLSNGAIITISGTTHYNGIYTVANQTSTSFTIVATYFAETTSVWQIGGGMISGCSTTGTTANNITLPTNLSNVPSRFNGVSPLSVFFDATGTQDAAYTLFPFHELQYTWDFGDPSGSPVSGPTWGNGSDPGANSRNAATGPLAAHVFEFIPGTGTGSQSYTVTLTVKDGTNTVSNSCFQIVAQNPNAVFAGTNTVCVAAFSLPLAGSGGCPSGAAVHQQAAFNTIISSYAATGTRVLLKRGDSFTASATAHLDNNGPGIIGSYGSGALPFIQTTNDQIILDVSNQATPTVTDWRVMDLEFDGGGSADSVAINGDGEMDNLTILRVAAQNVNYAFEFSDAVLDYNNAHGFPGHHLWNGLNIQDSTSYNIYANPSVAGYSVFASGVRMAILGNSFDNNGGGQHTVRLPTFIKSLLNNNTIKNPAFSKQVIKLNGPYWCNSNTTPGCNYTNDSAPTNTVLNDGIYSFGYTELSVVSDNIIDAGFMGTQWITDVAPINSNLDGRVRNLVLERNKTQITEITPTDNNVGWNMSAQYITIRNNIFNLTNSSTGHKDIRIQTNDGTGIEPPPYDIWVYNNTFYSSDTIASYSVNTNQGSNIFINNNLAYSPNASANAFILTGSGTFTASNNSTNSLMKSNSPLFTNPSPVLPADYKPTSGSYAIGAGTSVPVWSDLLLTTEPSPRDLGAVNH